MTAAAALRAVIVRYTVHPQDAEKNARLVAEVYDELARTRPEGLQYATFRLADDTFVHVALLSGEENPLQQSPAFAAFQAGLGERCSAGPVPASGTLVGSYRAY